MNWLSLDAFLTRIRPFRESLALALDMVAVALAWQATYLFRLGFERWFEARPGYDHWVMLAIVALYGVLLKLFRVPKGMWRFSGFGEEQAKRAIRSSFSRYVSSELVDQVLKNPALSSSSSSPTIPSRLPATMTVLM